MESEGQEVEMPPVDAGYLITYLFEVGPVLSSGMGPSPVSFSEMESWQRQTGVDLQPWEVQLLRRLSFDYLSEFQEAGAPERPAPWAPEDMTEKTREVVASKVQNAMRAFIQAKRKS